MFLDNKLKKEIVETRYLSVENTWRYRAIIRIMYKNYEKMEFWLLKEDIYDELMQYEDFKKYDINTLKQDLDVLAAWGNLNTIYDTRKMRTLDEFKNKQYKYQISSYTVEIERMLIKLENMREETRGSLEPTLVERFKEELNEINIMVNKPNNVVYEWWERLNRDFKTLNENYQDYISSFYSPKNEELMKTTQFLIYKERFISYLRDFIKGLQANSTNIKYFFEELEDNIVQHIILKILEYAKELPRVEETFDEESFKEYSYGRFYSIKAWFLGQNGATPMAEQLLDSTSEIIRKITRYAIQLAEIQHSNSNRKEEYKKISQLFAGCRHMGEAHKLSSVVFGVFSPKHIKGNVVRDTESLNSSIYEEAPYEFIVRPKNRSYRERTASRVPVKDRSEEKENKMKELIKKREAERTMAEKLIKNGKIVFGELEGISKEQRTMLLRWLSKAKSTKSFQGKTEYGTVYKVDSSLSKEYISVKCDDGDFKMPNYILDFING